MKNLENELLIASWTKTFGDNTDYKKGCKEALKFSINKREEGWTLEDFKADYLKTLEDIKGMYGQYIDGLLDGLRFNINEFKQQEVVVNE